MKISISKPCEENWLAMTANEKGKLCKKCDKTVVDFTTLNDFEVLDYFKINSKVCGRFNNTQLNRELGKQGLNTSKWAVAACSLLMVSAETVLAQDEIKANTKDSTVNNQVVNLALPNSVLTFSVTQPEDREEWITSLRLQIDSFSIECKVDSTETLTINTPKNFKNDSATIVLKNIKGDSFTIQIIRHANLNTIMSTFSNHYIFMFNGEKWSYVSPFIYRPETRITMGILPHEFEFKKFPEISWVNIYPLNIAYQMIDSTKEDKDSAKSQISDTSLKSDLILQKAKEVKAKKGFGIQAGIIVLIGILISFFIIGWRKFTKKG